MSSSPLHRSMSDEPIDLTNEDTKSSAPHHLSANGNSTSSTTINGTGPGAGKTRGTGTGSVSTSGGHSIHTRRSPPTLTSIVEENPERYDYEARVVNPFKAQQAMNAERKKKLKHEMIDFLVMYHAWTTSRFQHEKDIAAKTLEEKLTDVTETEREQETMRKQFSLFAATIKNALLALNGVGL